MISSVLGGIAVAFTIAAGVGQLIVNVIDYRITVEFVSHCFELLNSMAFFDFTKNITAIINTRIDVSENIGKFITENEVNVVFFLFLKKLILVTPITALNMFGKTFIDIILSIEPTSDRFIALNEVASYIFENGNYNLINFLKNLPKIAELDQQHDLTQISQEGQNPNHSHNQAIVNNCITGAGICLVGAAIFHFWTFGAHLA